MPSSISTARRCGRTAASRRRRSIRRRSGWRASTTTPGPAAQAWAAIRNAYVANLEMHGKGNFYHPRLHDPAKYPVAARTKQGHKQDTEDLDHRQAAGAAFNQLSLPTPEPPAGSFKRGAGERGREAVQRQGPVRNLPRAAAVHRAGMEHPQGRGDRHRRLPGQAAHPRAPIAPRRCGRCGTPTRSTRAASITTDASPRSTPWSGIMTTTWNCSSPTRRRSS